MKRPLLRRFGCPLLAIAGLSLAHGRVGTFTKAQVSDRIRKVEDGVDEFQKYRQNRGDKWSG